MISLRGNRRRRRRTGSCFVARKETVSTVFVVPGNFPRSSVALKRHYGRSLNDVMLVRAGERPLRGAPPFGIAVLEARSARAHPGLEARNVRHGAGHNSIQLTGRNNSPGRDRYARGYAVSGINAVKFSHEAIRIKRGARGLLRMICSGVRGSAPAGERGPVTKP